MAYPLALLSLTLDDPKWSKSRSHDFPYIFNGGLEAKYLNNGERYDDGPNKSRIGNRPLAVDWYHYNWPWMTLKGHFGPGHFELRPRLMAQMARLGVAFTDMMEIFSQFHHFALTLSHFTQNLNPKHRKINF